MWGPFRELMIWLPCWSSSTFEGRNRRYWFIHIWGELKRWFNQLLVCGAEHKYIHYLERAQIDIKRYSQKPLFINWIRSCDEQYAIKGLLDLLLQTRKVVIERVSSWLFNGLYFPSWFHNWSTPGITQKGREACLLAGFYSLTRFWGALSYNCLCTRAPDVFLAADRKEEKHCDYGANWDP